MQQLAASLRVPLEVRQGAHQAFHPGRCAELFVSTHDGAGSTSVGFAGELLPSFMESVDLPRVVAAAEIDLDALITASGEPHVAPIRSFPAATQDLSLIVSVEVPAAEVLDAVREGAGDLLESIRIVDDYRGAGLNQDTKSLTFALRFRAADRTLTAAEASESKNAGVAVAAARFGAQLRD
jgi:phenylalanyl-tRNA synthetase beta chain